MIHIIIATFCIILLVLFAYIKIRFPFWNNQPVFHTYDFWRYLYTHPFVLYKHCPIKTKFCDFSHIRTVPYLECSLKDKTDFANMLQCYYISSEKVCHTIKPDDIDAYFIGHSEPAFLSFYSETHYHDKIDPSNQIVCQETPVGVISSRPLTFYFRTSPSENVYTETPVYFIDFLCVHRERDSTKINRALLQTHEYNQRKRNPVVSISILKKEIALFDGVVPLTQYKNALFHLRPISVPKLPDHFVVQRITPSNSMDILVDFLYSKTHGMDKVFDIVLLPSIAAITSLIKQNLLYVYYLSNGEQIYGVYFFKDLKCEYDDIDGNTLQCIGSVMNIESRNLFFLGFLHSLRSILTSFRNSKPISNDTAIERPISNLRGYKMLFFEAISHNPLLMHYWREKHSPVFENDNAYYLFNFIYPSSPVRPEKCLILV